jgi:hypothetical protein
MTFTFTGNMGAGGVGGNLASAASLLLQQGLYELQFYAVIETDDNSGTWEASVLRVYLDNTEVINIGTSDILVFSNSNLSSTSFAQLVRSGPNQALTSTVYLNANGGTGAHNYRPVLCRLILTKLQ